MSNTRLAVTWCFWREKVALSWCLRICCFESIWLTPKIKAKSEFFLHKTRHTPREEMKSLRSRSNSCSSAIRESCSDSMELLCSCLSIFSSRSNSSFCTDGNEPIYTRILTDKMRTRCCSSSSVLEAADCSCSCLMRSSIALRSD